MAKEVHEGFPFSAAGLALALILSGGLAHAQSDVQDLPNMGQQIPSGRTDRRCPTVMTRCAP